MQKTSYYTINGITFYRLIAAPFLLYLLLTNRMDLFKWLLAFSFFTDAIDGYLARKYRVVSVLGARMDSIADDLTVLVGIIGLIMYRREFMITHIDMIIAMLILFLVQIIISLIKYRKTTSFHTILAKLAAIFQGIFLIITFFMKEPSLILFYLAVIVTMLDLIEEIILVLMIPKWKTDVKGIYWVLRKKPGIKN